MSYSGLYPVFDLALDVGDRDAALQMPYLVTKDNSMLVRSSSYGKVYVGGMGSVARPLDFSSGGWERKIEPSLAISISNDDLYGPFLPVKADPNVAGGYSEDKGYDLAWTTQATAYRTAAVLRGSVLRPAARSHMMSS